ncbi:sensor histidine kinase [Flagellimonas sp.]|uniref:sensor histidine kinase n=1 Tax=Flagellimonas sp. TaxID=2058762 RepID=UPI003BA87726
MKHWLSFFIIVFGWGSTLHANVQEDRKIPFEVFKDNLKEDSVDNVPIGGNFKPSSSFTERTSPDEFYWIRLDFTGFMDSFSENDSLYLKMNTFDHGSLYYWKANRVTKKTIGYFDKGSESEKIPFENYYSEVKLDADGLIDNRYLYIRAKRITFYESIQNWEFSLLARSSKTNYTLNDLKRLWPYFGFTGLCLVIWLSTLTFYFYLRRPEFLFYSTYILILYFYVCGDILNIYDSIFSENHLLQHWISQSVIQLANVCYGFFFIYYLGTKKDYPKIHSLMYIIMSLIFVPILLIVVLYLFNYMDGLIFINAYFMKAVFALYALGLVYIIFNAKNAQAYFVLPASFSFLISYMLHVYFADPNDGLLLNSRYYLLIGCSFEILIFSVGLNYKVHLEFRRNLALQQDALTEKTKALRAQINPHFIFNALNSLQNLVIKNNTVSSLKYLSNFSRLVRNVLESSFESNAALEMEIKMLNDYLELESLRFDNAFSYEINCQTDIDTASTEIPFMICQPFAENAIIHGLLPKQDGEKRLTIDFNMEGNLLVCTIDDTGVGRQATEDNGPWQQEKKKSRGIEVSKLRLDSSGKTSDNYEIIDKKDSNGNPMGTKVILKLVVEV